MEYQRVYILVISLLVVMGAITSVGKNYKPRPSTPVPITGAGSRYKPKPVASVPVVVSAEQANFSSAELAAVS